MQESGTDADNVDQGVDGGDMRAPLSAVEGVAAFVDSNALYELAQVMAPFAPFLADHLYLQLATLGGTVLDNDHTEALAYAIASLERADTAEMSGFFPDLLRRGLTLGFTGFFLTEEAVRKEYFSVPERPDDVNHPFTVRLARSGREVEVAKDEAITDALRTEMKNDDRVVVFGEDVGKKGGVFGATAGLHDEFGEHRCFDTPLSECGILGAGVGMTAGLIIYLLGGRVLGEAGKHPARPETPEAAAAVPEIRRRLDDAGCPVPLIGDFHYNGHVLLQRLDAIAGLPVAGLVEIGRDARQVALDLAQDVGEDQAGLLLDGRGDLPGPQAQPGHRHRQLDILPRRKVGDQIAGRLLPDKANLGAPVTVQGQAKTSTKRSAIDPEPGRTCDSFFGRGSSSRYCFQCSRARCAAFSSQGYGSSPRERR